MGTAIAKNYPVFIDAFQNYVAKRQEEVRKTESQQATYGRVRDALLRWPHDNETKLNLDSSGVSIAVTALPEDRMPMFSKLAALVGEALSKPDIDPRGTFMGHWEPEVSWKFQIFDRGKLGGTVTLKVSLPKAGLSDFALRQVKRKVEWETVEYEPVDGVTNTITVGEEVPF